MCRWLISLVCLLIFSLPICASSTERDFGDYIYFTEEYPPYNYVQNGQLTGISVDLLQVAAKKAGREIPDNRIRVLPWARSYKLTQMTAFSVLFSTARTKQREDLFKWVGPIASSRIVLLGKKEPSIRISNKEQIKQYSIGVIIDDVGEQLITHPSIMADKIEYAHSNGSLIRMLESGRIDLWAYEEQVALWAIHETGYNPQDYEVVFSLEEVDYYYALNKNAPDLFVQSFQQALDKLKASTDQEESYRSIIQKYNKWNQAWKE